MTYVKEAFDTNWVAPLGANVDGFERDLEAFTGAGYAAALSSGTAALHLALIILGVGRNRYLVGLRFGLQISACP